MVAFQIVAAVASAAPKAAQTQAAAGKIPVTSASDEARSAFFKDRDLAEKLRATDGRQYYLKASELDQSLRLALWGSPTPRRQLPSSSLESARQAPLPTRRAQVKHT